MQSASRRIEREWLPDNYGNVASSSTKTIVGESQLLDTVLVNTQYHVDPLQWLVSLPELVTTTNVRSGETEYSTTAEKYGSRCEG